MKERERQKPWAKEISFATFNITKCMMGEREDNSIKGCNKSR